MIQNVDIELIVPSPMNPRKHFDAEALSELSESIKQQGLLQPITVRPVNLSLQYEIVCGERRYRAAKMAGLPMIMANVREMTDAEAFDAMITENLQRRDVNPMEEADEIGRAHV